MGKIKFNNKIYETFNDTIGGSERFVGNNLINKMCINFEIKSSDMVKMLELDAITLMDLLDYYAARSISVSTVNELSFFENLDYERIE